MPFTLSHPAAVLPLHRLTRGSLPLSALAIGSMAPDFVYYAPFGVDGRYSHGIEGLFLFCVPAGLLAWLLFHVFLKRPLAVLLPDAVFRRLPDHALDNGDWRRTGVARVFAALWLGALSHIVWDSLTHVHLELVPRLAMLQSVVWVYDGYQLRLYRLLQHLSTGGGLAVLLVAGWRWSRHARAVRAPGASLPALPKSVMIGMVLLIALARGVERMSREMSGGLEDLMVRGMLGSITGAALPVFLFCAAWHVTEMTRRVRRTRG